MKMLRVFTLLMIIAFAMVLMLSVVQLALRTPLQQGYGVDRISRLAGFAQKNGYPVAVYPQRFQQQFHFAGRLEHPLVALTDAESMMDWIERHPNGYLVLIHRPEDTFFPQELALYRQRFRGRLIDFWNAATLVQYRHS